MDIFYYLRFQPSMNIFGSDSYLVTNRIVLPKLLVQAVHSMGSCHQTHGLVESFFSVCHLGLDENFPIYYCFGILYGCMSGFYGKVLEER